MARKIVKDNYLVYEDYNKYAWPPIDANLNGAYGIMALLYGQGNFQKTLDYSCAFGMDADNQAATMCGLLGIVNGLDSIPKNLMYPLEDVNWNKPAAMRIPPDSQGLVLAMVGDRSSTEYSPICASANATLNTPHKMT